MLPEEQVPWAAWLGPLWSWGLLLLFAWLMMIGLAMIVVPQWRHHERLAFPLLRIHETLIEPPEAGRLLPPLFRQRAFWLAAGAVLVLRLMAELSRYFRDEVLQTSEVQYAQG